MGTEPQEHAPNPEGGGRHGVNPTLWRRALWWVGWVLLVPVLVPFAVQIAGGPVPAVPPFLVGAVVVEIQAVALVAFVAGVLCRVASFGWWLMRFQPAPAGLVRTVLAALRTVIAGIVSLVVLLCAAGGALLMLMSTSGYHVLSPPSPAGCRIVLSTQSWFDATGGEVYLAAPGSPVLRDTGGSWVSDPPHDPIATKTWSLAWGGETAQVSVWRDSQEGAPISLYQPPHQPITCPR